MYTIWHMASIKRKAIRRLRLAGLTVAVELEFSAAESGRTTERRERSRNRALAKKK